MMSASGNGWLLKNTRLADKAGLVDISIQGEYIERVGPNLAPPSGAQILDLGGRLVVPGFVDAHMHLDKAYALDAGLEPSDSLIEAIDDFMAWNVKVTPETLYKNARKAAEQALLHGTLALRTHVTVDYRIGNQWVEMMTRLREEMAPWLQIQLVAFPMAGMLDSQEGLAIVREMLADSQILIGSAAARAPDPKKEIDTVFELAGEFGCNIDLHIDESDDPAENTLDYLVDRKLALGFEGIVTAGHCCSLSARDEAHARRVIEKVAEAGINIITLPSCNLYLMGRRDKGLIRRGLTRVRELLAAGVNVAYGSDNIRDAFNPYGRADMLQGAMICGHALQWGTRSELQTLLQMGTYNPARILPLPDYGLEPGCTASLVVLDDEIWGSAVAREASRRYVFSHGRLVAQTQVSQSLLDESYP